MTNLRQAAQQALEALTLSIPKPRPADDDYAELGWKEHNAAITALRAALAEPEHAELERKSDAIQRLWKERDELRSECRTLVRQNGEWQELNAELVEALRCADAMLSGANMDAKAVERKVSAALAKVEASNGS